MEPSVGLRKLIYTQSNVNRVHGINSPIFEVAALHDYWATRIFVTRRSDDSLLCRLHSLAILALLCLIVVIWISLSKIYSKVLIWSSVVQAPSRMTQDHTSWPWCGKASPIIASPRTGLQKHLCLCPIENRLLRCSSWSPLISLHIHLKHKRFHPFRCFTCHWSRCKSLLCQTY